ncbi:MAG: hypothetical protein AAF513_01065 [Pseudomonadota bacterium]
MTDHHQGARDIVQAYIDTFNAQDPEAFARTLHYPHMRIDGLGRVRTWQSWEAYAAEVDFARLRETGWHHSVLDWQKDVQLGASKAHIAVNFTRYREDSSVIVSQESLYVVTLQDGRWGISVRSSFLEETLPS